MFPWDQDDAGTQKRNRKSTSLCILSLLLNKIQVLQINDDLNKRFYRVWPSALEIQERRRRPPRRDHKNWNINTAMKSGNPDQFNSIECISLEDLKA